MCELTLICRSCQAVLCKSLVPVKRAEAVKEAFSARRDKHWSVVTHGFVLFVDSEVKQTINREHGWALEKSEVWVNPEDLAEGVTLADGYPTNCCGPDGMKGPNRRCCCGALVGTEESECFQLGTFRPDEAATFWQGTGVLAKMERAS